MTGAYTHQKGLVHQNHCTDLVRPRLAQDGFADLGIIPPQFLTRNPVAGPDWFQKYIAAPRDTRFVEVDGASIHYDTWAGPAGAPGLLFVHGNGAHSHWFDFIAPAFCEHYNVMAMDMSGAGDSGHRGHYTATGFAREIIEVCRDAGFRNTVVAGHSFGGTMTRITGYLYGEELAGIVLLDSAISSSRGRRGPPPAPRSAVRYYESLEQGARRFRLRPPQPCENDWIIDYIARHSLRKTEQGYCFKLDQALFSKMTADAGVDLPDAVTMLGQVKCPVGFIYGEQSRFFPPEAVALLKSAVDPDYIESIPGAHHHIFLDQPLAFIETLSRLLQKNWGQLPIS